MNAKEQANEATLQRQLEEAATDNETRTIARIMAEIAEEHLNMPYLAVVRDCFI